MINAVSEVKPILAPKILYFDIESAGVNALRSDLGFVIVFGYKWSDENEPKAIMLDRKHLLNFDDSKLLAEVSKLFEKADLVVGHYASVFDKRFLQGRLLVNGLPPVPQTKLRDTWEIVRKVANFSSNRLKHLAKVLNFKHQKLENNWPVAWFKVMQGDTEVLRGLAEYCKGDVLVVEELYQLVMPYDTQHPIENIRQRLMKRRLLVDGPLETPCWIWQGSVRNKRYGDIRVNGRAYLVHVIAYEIFRGIIPLGLELDHLCREPRCFNPDHLEPVTHSENLRRADSPNKRKKVCLRGHKFYVRRRSDGRLRRDCRECEKIRRKERMFKKAA